MLRFGFWWIWLAVVSGSMVLFGLALAFATPKWLLPTYHHAVNRVLWHSETLPTDVVVFHDWIFAVLGATIASQAAMMLFIVLRPFARREPWAWWAILFGMSIWFVPDTLLSLYYGVWPNATFNIVAFAAILLPLVFTYRSFRSQRG